MPTSQQIEQALKSSINQRGFIQSLLIDALGWPVPEKVEAIEDISYDWSQDDLRALELDKKIVQGKAFQIQIKAGQPWGIFLLEFKNRDAIVSGRGMTGPLRKVLRGLVQSRRSRPDLPAWKREHLLFICTHDFKDYRFAYFKAPPDGIKTAPLASFGWEEEDPARRTVCEFNLPHLRWPGDAIPSADWVSQWAEAFNVEKVTKRFYEEYAQTFEKVKKIIKTDAGIGGGEDLHMFTQTLFNRLMFLRFIERKGWMEIDGKKDYLRALFAKGAVGKQSFYKSRIRPLFFEGLAKEEHNCQGVIGTVPFLNGGLFEESELDAKVKDLDDKAFEPIIGANGLFYRFNFTVEESTPHNIEVAVDPEMLGKVFEELVTGRHESGSYYTPRRVVTFMCREALKGYLADETHIDAHKLADFVDKHDLSGITIENAKKIAQALDDVRAVDPACGSGAYLLGLLHEIVDLYRLIYSDKLKTSSRELHKIKLDVIEKSLYGVDIDPFATNIAMLRLWLSLTVDSDEPQALPNLDFKIETGNSLTGPDPSQFSDLHLHEPARQLAILKAKYMRAHGDEKRSLRRLIQKDQRELAFELRSLPSGAVEWRVQFCEIFFSDRGGFDIVLANPPYVRQELIKDIKPLLKRVYGHLYSGTADLYVFFYLRALQLLAKNGMLVFISSNKWFRAEYGKKLRERVASSCFVRSITDFKDLPVFESAIAYAMIFVARKGQPDGSTLFTEPPTLDAPYPDIQAVIAKYGQPLPRAALKSPLWTFSADGTLSVLDSISKLGQPLREHAQSRLFRGLTTGFNDAFVLDRRTRDELVKANKHNAEIIKPLAMGRDVTRWAIEAQDRWMIVTPIGVDMKRYPEVMEHLNRWESELRKRYDQGNHWWELRACDYYGEFEKPKIVSTKVSIRPTFALDVDGRYLGNTAYFIPVSKAEGRYLLGILNSIVFFAYAKEVFVEKQNGWYEVQPKGLEAFPIAKASPEDKKAIQDLVDKCISAKGEACERWERELDDRVAALYQIKQKDLRVLRKRVSLTAEDESAQVEKSEEYKEFIKQQFGT